MKNSKKIVILTQYFPPEMGAPQLRLFETAIALKKFGWDLTVITAMPNYPTGKIFHKYRNKFYLKENIKGIKVYRYLIYPSKSKKSLSRIISMFSISFSVLFSILSLLKQKPEYIITESPPLLLSLSGMVLSKLSNSKHIMNVSDLWPLTALILGAISNGGFYKMLVSFEKFLYRNSYACIGQSNEIINHLNKNGSKNSLLFRNGVDLERFKNLKRKHNKGKILKLVYAGLIGVAQGILQICKNINFKELGSEFHIYGDGYEKQMIISFIKANPDRGIILHDSVNKQKIPITLIKYDVSLIPLIMPIYGAVPSKIYESMAAGLPIIFNGGGEGANIISDYNLGWNCKPKDYKKIKKIIREVISMKNHDFNKLHLNCFYASNKIFNRKIQIDNLNKFLTSNL